MPDSKPDHQKMFSSKTNIRSQPLFVKNLYVDVALTVAVRLNHPFAWQRRYVHIAKIFASLAFVISQNSDTVIPQIAGGEGHCLGTKSTGRGDCSTVAQGPQMPSRSPCRQYFHQQNINM